MSFWVLKKMVFLEGSIPAADSTRTSRVKPRFVGFSGRKRIWNICLHAGVNHLCYALSTLRGTPPIEAVIILRFESQLFLISPMPKPRQEVLAL
ncbi:UNVERIFIED_CONTAM: hypothetical protein RMT77_015410 [Armadillidium vulgare]